MAQCNVTAAERVTRNRSCTQRHAGGLWGGEPAHRTTPPSWWEEGGCDADGVRRVAAERPYHRHPQLHVDREAGRDCVLSVELVPAELLTVKRLHGSRSALVSGCQAGR